MKNHYKTLGVRRQASDNEIKTAYKQLAFRYHPDMNPGNKAAEEYFKEINAAYHVLSNRVRRERYNMLLDFEDYNQQPLFTTYHYPYHYKKQPTRRRTGTLYRFDRTYFKNQALAISIVLAIGLVVISITEINRYLKEQEREQLRMANQQILSSAHVKFNMGDFYGALQMVQGLASKHPADFELDMERDKMTEELYQKARRQFVLQDYHNAIFNLLIVKEFQHPQKLDTYEYLARSYIAINEYEKAAAAYEYIFLRDKYNIELALRIAMLYHYQIKEIDKAQEYYDKAKVLFKERQKQLYGKAFELLMDPIGTPELYFKIFHNRAKANIEAGEYETAVTDCNWATFLRPNKDEAYYLRAYSYYMLNENQKACKEFNVAIEKGYKGTPSVEFCK